MCPSFLPFGRESERTFTTAPDSHQAVKYDYTADLIETANQSEEVSKSQSFC